MRRQAIKILFIWELKVHLVIIFWKISLTGKCLFLKLKALIIWVCIVHHLVIMMKHLSLIWKIAFKNHLGNKLEIWVNSWLEKMLNSFPVQDSINLVVCLEESMDLVSHLQSINVLLLLFLNHIVTTTQEIIVRFFSLILRED